MIRCLKISTRQLYDTVKGLTHYDARPGDEIPWSPMLTERSDVHGPGILVPLITCLLFLDPDRSIPVQNIELQDLCP